MKHLSKVLMSAVLFAVFTAVTYAQKFEWVKPASSGATAISVIGTATDEAGNCYSLMQFEGTITIEGNNISPLIGFVSNLVIKHNSYGMFQWAIPFGDTSGYYSYDIKAHDNEVYVFYETNNSPTVFPDTIVQPVSFAQMVKLDSDGNFLSIIPMGINCNHPYLDDQYFDILNGNIFYAACENGYEEIRKINPVGSNITICTLYDTVAGSEVQINDVKCTPDGDILILGMLHSGTLRAGTFLIESYPCCNGYTSFILRMDTSGVVKWLQRYTWNGNSFAVSGDENGNSYLTGDIRFPDFKYGDTLTLPYAGKNEAVLFKLDATGNIIWHKTYYSTANSTYTAMCRINDLYVNSQEEIFIMGFYWGLGISPYAPYTPKPDQHYMIKLDSDGNKIWFTDFNDMPPFPGWSSHIATSDGSHFQLFGEMIPGDSRFGCLTAGSVFNNFYIANLNDTTSPVPYVRFEYSLDNTAVYFTNYSLNYDSVLWSFGDSTFSKQVNPSHIYASAGIYNVALAAYNSCGTNYANAQLIIKGVGNITPNYSSGNGYTVTDLFGAGFKPGTTLTLSKVGFTDIIPDTIIFIDSTRMQVNFNFQNELTGSRDIVIAIPGTGTFTLENGFEIQPLKKFEPWIETSPDYILRQDEWKQYEVKVGNNGNETGYGILVYLATSGNNEIELENYDDTTGFNISPPWLNTLPDGSFYISDVDDAGDSISCSALILPFLRPGEIFNIRLLIKTADNPVELTAIVYNEPLYSLDSFSTHLRFNNDGTSGITNPPEIQQDPDYSYCWQCIEETWENSMEDCLANLKTALDASAPFINYMVENWGYISSGEMPYWDGDVVVDLFKAGGSALIECVDINYGKYGKYLKKIENLKDLKDKYDLYQDIPEGCVDGCWEEVWSQSTFKSWSETRLVELVEESLNIITGHTGITAENYASNKSDLFYNINFENADSIASSVREVVITDQLDTSLLDLSTFRFSGFGFGGEVQSSAIKAKSYIKDFDLRPERNCILRANFSLDEQTGIATWRFNSYDPVTLDTISNFIDGFLPPNINHPEGEGFVKYRIKPRQGLPHMTVISNYASIILDKGTPILTNAWINTIDTVKPESTILALPSHTGDTAFYLHWTGSDAQAGFMDCKIYVSDNDSAYVLWEPFTYKDSTAFYGRQGHQYKFYSVARDLVLNIEDPPVNALTNPDAVTIIDTTISVNEINKPNYHVLLIPNPAQNSAVASFNYSHQSRYELNLLDETGRIVKTFSGISKPGENKIEMSLSGIANGIYQTNFRIENSFAVNRLIKMD